MIRSMIKRKDDSVDTITAVTVEEYRPHKIRWHSRKQYRSSVLYAADYAVLDTETSHFGAAGWIYQWAVYFQGDYIIGRRPSELLELFRHWKTYYGLCSSRRILVYIHNMSYDLQYLKWFLLKYDPDTRFFCTDPHTVLIVDMDGIRICCSYKLTNLSLAKLADSYADTYVKASGEIDYNVVRYQDSDLTGRDWLYMLSDVASQYDGIRGYLRAMGYRHAADAPYTSTGFVRVSGRRESEREYWFEKFQECALQLEQYKLCNQGFIGGQVIASYLYAGRIVEDLGHVDFTSSYPTRIMLDYLPKGKGFWAGAPQDPDDLELLMEEFCCVFIAYFHNITIRPKVSAPYIPGSKALFCRADHRSNGKLVHAEDFSMAMTEVDWKWIKRQYTWERVEIGSILCFARGTAPGWLKKQTMEYYRKKCELKHVDPALYAASKAMLNSLYGMTATQIVRQEYAMDEHLMISQDNSRSDEEQLEKYYSSRKNFMPYQYSLYITAWARDALHTLIESIGYDNFVYCDTDSVFYRNRTECRQAIEDYNTQIIRRSLAAGAYIDDDNILGVAEDEPHIKRFKALHAKCYAYETDDDQLHVTIAGIPKKTTKWIDGEPVTITSADELGDLDNLADGFVFRHNGGSRILYVEEEPQLLEINGHETELASAAIIEDIEKEISDTMYSVGKNYELLHLEFEQAIEF